MKGGGFERLAFQGNRVIETRNMKTGDTHTPAEFAKDRTPKAGLRRLMP